MKTAAEATTRFQMAPGDTTVGSRPGRRDRNRQKDHLAAIAIARSCIRAGKRGRFFNTVELVTRLETEARAGRQGRFAEYLTRMDFVILR